LSPLQRICVFCGSSPGSHPEYLEAARSLGRELARRHIGLVYGGASVGMMGELARVALREGGQVTGVIPRELEQAEVALRELSDLRVVQSMHERKALMAGLADGFVALPGGFGTLEEFFEVVTWAQLGIHSKPCALLDVRGYFRTLLDFLDLAMAEQFIGAPTRSLVLVDRAARNLLDRMEAYRPPSIDKAARARELSGNQVNAEG
jgi:uncharacterized protein (TIGR00730 family)